MSKDKQSVFADKITIFVDHREGKELIDELKGYVCVVRERQLPVADFLVSDRVAVERKTYDDFVQSMIDGRLFSQLLTLKEHFDKPVLLIEGQMKRKRNVYPQAIRGCLSAVAIDYSIPILWTKDRKDTAGLIYCMAKREQKKKNRGVAIRNKKKARSLKERQEYLVAGLPNVNTALAKRLLKHFKKVEEIFTETKEGLKEVEGIGEEKARLIRKVLTKKYR